MPFLRSGRRLPSRRAAPHLERAEEGERRILHRKEGRGWQMIERSGSGSLQGDSTDVGIEVFIHLFTHRESRQYTSGTQDLDALARQSPRI